MGFSANQLLFGFIMAATIVSLGTAFFNCYIGHSTVEKSGHGIKQWATNMCHLGATQCLKLECENDMGKTVQVKCGNGFAKDCTEEVKSHEELKGNCPVPVGKSPAVVTKCTSCNSDNCWGTSALPAPEYHMPSAPPAPKSNEGGEQPAPKPDKGEEKPAPKPTEAEAAAASHVPIIGAIGLMAIGVAIILLGGIH